VLKKSSFLLLWTIFCLFRIEANDRQENETLMQSQIKHVVVLMLENRSFDNVLAWLYDKEHPPKNFIPSDSNQVYLGLLEDQLDQYTNYLKNSIGDFVFSCKPMKGVPSVIETGLLNSPKFDPNEPFQHVTNQIFGFDGSSVPTMNGFLQDYASVWDEEDWFDQKEDICAVMETYTDKELPVLYGLAKHYAVSDLWFSSVPTQTNPNRAFLACGTSEGQIVNAAFLAQSVFYSDTIWNRLSEESPETSWTIFWHGDVIPVICPGSYCLNTFANLKEIPNVDSHFQKLDSFHELARSGQLPAFSFIEPQWTLSIHVSPDEKEDFINKILCGEDLILGLQGNDMHPPGDVRTAENLLANIYTSLIANPETWNHTLLIITFDEHGGIFDHIPPPAAIPPDDNFQNGFCFDRYGVRVPALFISPLIQKETVIRSDDPLIPFDHTSVISTLLKWKKIEKSNWKMGRRVDAAPLFDRVITLHSPRNDSAVCDESIIPPKEEDIVQMGDLLYLKHAEGEYIAKSGKMDWLAPLGNEEERVALKFAGGRGKITHGSFVQIKSTSPILGKANLLENVMRHIDCKYGEDSHFPGQWWTIKSLDHPVIGSEIVYGDRVYLENHIYLDLFQYVPGRLSKKKGLFSSFLSTTVISDEASKKQFWIIEKKDKSTE
jgi:phospholipase C